MKKTIILLLLLFSCGKGENKLAVVGNKTITAEDVVFLTKKQPEILIPLIKTEQGRDKLLESMLDNRVLELEAENYGVLNDLATRKEIEEAVSTIKINALIKKIQETAEFEPKEDEIKKYYNDNLQDFKKPVSLRASQILLFDEKKVPEISVALKNGTSFEKLAAQYSEDRASRAKSGDMGFINKGDLIEELETVLFAMRKTGEISVPVKSPFGVHLLKLTDRKVKAEITYESAYNVIKNLLTKKKYEEFIGKAKRKYNVKKYNRNFAKNLDKIIELVNGGRDK